MTTNKFSNNYGFISGFGCGSPRMTTVTQAAHNMEHNITDHLETSAIDQSIEERIDENIARF